jgi:competence protein ComEA
MFKKLLAFFAAMYMAVSFAAVDVNKATAAELDGIKGIGPAISGKIVDERKKGNFKDWNDFIERVKGVGEGNAAKFSAEGLTVGGAGFKGTAAPAAAAKKDEKPVTAVAPAAKAEEKKVEAKPAAVTAPAAPASAAKEVKKDAKAEAKAKADEAKAKKEADAKAKADEKKKKADEAKAKADADKAAKADAKKAKEAKPAAKDDAKADAAKPAASAAKK